MRDLILVFIGGGLGSMLRYGLGRLIFLHSVAAFPVATLIINIISSLILGLFLGFLDWKNISNPGLKLLVAVGFCGGFSTFSTFSNETLTLLRNGQSVLALSYIFISVVLCLGATLAGALLAKAF